MAEAYHTVRNELEAYGEGLIDKPEIVALSKTDTLDPETREEKLAALTEAVGRPVRVLSAVSREGMTDVLRDLRSAIDAEREAETEGQPTGPDPRWQRGEAATGEGGR